MIKNNNYYRAGNGTRNYRHRSEHGSTRRTKRKDENSDNRPNRPKLTTGSLPKSSKHDNSSKKNNKRNSRHHHGLWKAHHIGIIPSFLTRKDLREINCNKQREILPEDVIGDLENSISKQTKEKNESNNVSTKDGGIKSDSEVRNSNRDSDASSASSWADDEGGFEHYDCWQLLYDEYARDFGFGGAKAIEPNTSLPHNDVEDEDYDQEDENQRQFRILGTAADDLRSQPHCLSPPLMDSLLNFVPDSLSCENFWLKYSLVRDGASLNTFRQYARAATHTILAIQTTKGDVFGCFTSSPWHTQNDYFGSGESFVWKMRLNRETPCYSLYDQAHLESEIDVYPFSGFNNTVQLCRHDMIAVGGSDIENTPQVGFEYRFSNYKNEETGFAIALQDDLCRGTSVACPTFCSPSLISNNESVFDVENLEVWTFTPCNTVDEAEKLEMRKYFATHTTYTSSGSQSTLSSFDYSPTSSSKNLQKQFYYRLGDMDGHDVDRDCWAEASSIACDLKLTNQSPRFLPR